MMMLVSACAPKMQEAAVPISPPALEASPVPAKAAAKTTAKKGVQRLEGVFLPGDGARLPLRAWLPVSAPRAVIAAVHGFNDYSHAFTLPGGYFAARGIATYAYDQRGFGAAPEPGVWPGEANLTGDLRRMVELLRARHPGAALYIMGESMGGAVAVAALTEPDFPKVDGAILLAPALWGGHRMNPLFRLPLWLLAHSFPAWRLSGQELQVQACDNKEVMAEINKDPLFIKATRTDAILGLVRLMDRAYADMHRLQTPALLLYGAHDEVIPAGPIADARQAMPHAAFIRYPDGWHMLLRDQQRDTVAQDIVEWIDGRIK